MEKQYPVLKEIDSLGKAIYTYVCNGCGKELRGYKKKSINGKVWCRYCHQKNQQDYTDRKEDEKLEDFLHWLSSKGYIKEETSCEGLINQYRGDNVWKNK